MKLTTRRSYNMRARAEAVAATRDRILDATVATFWDSPSMDVPLDEVAARAGVSVQTVIRHFGSKSGLFEAAGRRERARIVQQRDEAPAGDVRRAIRVLMDHYEELGDRVIRLLAEEHRTPALSEVVEVGRSSHRSWCERVFASTLTHRVGVDRGRRLAQLIAICDVYTWKLLRKDAGLSRRQTEIAVFEMLEPLVEVD